MDDLDLGAPIGLNTFRNCERALDNLIKYQMALIKSHPHHILMLNLEDLCGLILHYHY